MALKIDISKAYDLKMGFEGRWVDWIMLCVTTVKYSIQVNGGLVGPIQPKRVLRQGDPLSPYLFIMCAEGVRDCQLALLKQEERRGHIHGAKHLPSSFCRRQLPFM